MKKISERKKAQIEEIREELTIEQEVDALLESLKLDTGRWIMIKHRLPPMEFEPPEPLSIHWSVPWPMQRSAVIHQALCKDSWGFMGNEHDYGTARKIILNGHEFRVFEDEFIFVSTDSMDMYVYGIDGEGPSHTLCPGNGIAEERMIDAVLNGEQRPIYDAALVDGATPAQAIQTALGMDVLGGVMFPPIGWYKPSSEVVHAFVRDS